MHNILYDISSLQRDHVSARVIQLAGKLLVEQPVQKAFPYFDKIIETTHAWTAQDVIEYAPNISPFYTCSWTIWISMFVEVVATGIQIPTLMDMTSSGNYFSMF